MPRKKATKAAAPKASASGVTPRVNKSAWIRAQPDVLKASQVVEQAKKEGIVISEGQVYTARSSAKKAKKPGRPKGSKGKKSAAKGGNVEQAVRGLALLHGIIAVEACVKKIRVEAGL